MKKNLNLVILTFLTTLCGLSAQKTIYVSPNNIGNDISNDGLTSTSPFKTISKAVSEFNTTEGGTIYLLEGIYHEEVIIDGKDKITIEPFNNENVVMNGSIDITSSWTQHSGNIYKTQLTEDVWQLFIDDEEKVMARWPNTTFENDAIYDNENWAHGYVEKDNTSNGDGIKDNADYNGYIQEKSHAATPALNTLGSIDGSLLIANIGSFRTFVTEVTSEVQTAKTLPNGKVLKYDYFTHTPVKSNDWRDKEHFYFLEGKLDFLDAQNEWFYDKTSKTLYAWSNDNGNDLNNASIKGKTHSYGFDIRNADEVEVKDLKFFASTVRIYNSSNINIYNNVFSYPNCSKRMLGVKTSPLVTSVDQKTDGDLTSNGTSFNCTFEKNVFEYTDGEALILGGDEHKIINNYFHHIDYTCAAIQGIGLSIMASGSKIEFDHNIMHTTGASATINLGPEGKIRYNDISNTGLGQSDGSVIQLTKNIVEGSETSYNWLHDTGKYGFRFDAVIGNAGGAGQKGLAHHNVIWNLGDAIHGTGGIGMMIKGEYQEIYNNTCFDNLKVDINILEEQIDPTTTTNMFTITRNNAADRISNHRTQINTFPGVQSNNTYAKPTSSKENKIAPLLENVNVVYDPSKVVENRDLYDFRPKATSTQLINKARKIEIPVYSSLSYIDITAGFIGNKPDRGAYEYGKDKWIPGIDFTPETYPWTWPVTIATSGFINHSDIEDVAANTHWFATGNNIIGGVTTIEAHTGLNSYTINAPNTNWINGSNKTKQIKAVVESDPNFVYLPPFTSPKIDVVVSFWIKVDQDQDNGAADRIKLRLMNTEAGQVTSIADRQIVIGDPSITDTYISQTTGWKKIETTFIGVDYKQSYTTHLELWLGNLSGNVYLDDFNTTITSNNLSPKSNDKGQSIETVSETAVSLRLYPQPVRNNTPLYIESSETIKGLSLYSIKGNKVYETSRDIKEIPTDNLHTGIYILKIILSDNSVVTKQISVIH